MIERRDLPQPPLIVQGYSYGLGLVQTRQDARMVTERLERRAQGDEVSQPCACPPSPADAGELAPARARPRGGRTAPGLVPRRHVRQGLVTSRRRA